MKKFWKWFFIVLGILAVVAIAFCVTMFFLRGGSQLGAYGPRGYEFPGGMMGRTGFRGGMMFFGMGWMLLRGLFGLAILVLAGFGVASLVRKSKAAPQLPATLTCPACGKPLSADWKACPHCGAAINTEATPVVEEPVKKTKAKTS